jgi:cyclopropane fatty-acyl-phospholipid synthase-like methyltransferase
MPRSRSPKNYTGVHQKTVEARSQTELASVAGVGLEQQHFVQIASNGFGDPQNSYAFSMAWFQNHLYVGTNRNMLVLVKASPPPDPARMEPWPVRVPKDVFKLDLRSQIWRYSPSTGQWDQIYVSPMVPGPDEVPTPRDIGYRDMTVFQRPTDLEPALYIATASSNTRGPGAYILRYTETEGVIAASKPGFGDQNVSTFRTLVGFNGHLYSSPAGSGRAWNAADRPCVYESKDPISGKWRSVSESSFGDKTNDVLYSMCEFNEHLYVGTLNPVSGYQIWKTRAIGEPPYRWQRVVDSGAGRGNLNEAAMTMCVFNEALYVGSGISNGGYDRSYHVGPGAGEVIRIYPDDSWDLVVGTARDTEDGYKHSLSGMGPGFDNPFAGYIWSMAVHDGWLYIGIFDSSIFALWADLKRQPRERQIMLRWIGVDNFVQQRAGFELWRSNDGIYWAPVTSKKGFGNPYNYGVRNMVSTPVGLFVGTANPFGPEVAVKFADGWGYAPNPRGGLEVWLGSSARKVDTSSSDTAPVKSQRTTGHSVFTGESGWKGQNRMAQLNENINHAYRRMYHPLVQEFYHGSDFYNFGYWFSNTQSLRKACENLMEELLAFIPEKKGTILDVACGKGATTRYLTRYYDETNVVGINISEEQLKTCHENAPGCHFFKMDAVNLTFEDESFDAVISVEAAFHFNTRERFFREAHRVLVSGGYLVLSDILLTEWVEWSNPVFVSENHVKTLSDYRALLRRVGFRETVVRDVTGHTLGGCIQYIQSTLLQKLRRGQIDLFTFNLAMSRLYKRKILPVNGYILVGARKS